ncbi:hypothetical protein [Duganella sp. BuS-21]|uniref:Cap15 family cyclic dinucleotide receptor domain-containing protein n=1 Tax=Duganella sp. BuS-21 TaxID=2943848 RepID=UPI0035A6E5FE
MRQHEYSILGGFNRAKIGHWIGVLAALLSSVLIGILIFLIKLAEHFGWTNDLPPLIFWPIGAGVIYFALYYYFDNYFWRLEKISGLLKVPDLSGSWKCVGVSVRADKTLAEEWHAEIEIIQSWDLIRVRLRTEQSASNSTTAALIFDAADGYRLMYSYKNEPKATQQDLQEHRGFAELTFSKDLQSAEGEYFNGIRRFTFGTMKLSRG